MSKKKKLFVVSDLHGHCALLEELLNEAGFDNDNADHLFICCGDLFDRGVENRKVYEFINGLKHKVLIRGNHDERLAQVLRRNRIDAFDIRNGMLTTIEEFFGEGSIGDYGDLIFTDADEVTASALCALVDGMADYYETENYVFVHGWLPTQVGANPPKILDDWRVASAQSWSSSRFSEWMPLYKSGATLPDKTIICGHRPTRLASQIDATRSPADSSIFYGEGMIAIDAGTIRSKRMNLLLLEDADYLI